MADPILVPVTALPPADPLGGAELVPVVQGGVSKRVTAQAIADLAPAAPPGGSATEEFPLPVPVTGHWGVLSATNAAAFTSGYLSAVGAITFVRFRVERPITVTDLAVEILAASVGGMAVGIYDADPATGLPANRVAVVSGLNSDATGTKSGTVGSVVLARGAYWFAVFTESNPNFRALATGAVMPLSATSPTSSAPITALRSVGSQTTLPAAAPAISAAVSLAPPVIFAKYTVP